MRVGLGFDAHTFGDEGALILGGVEIPGSPGLAGHSDADVLSHAVADALLGAARLGDLGDSFPATDEWRDASSLDMLSHTATALKRAGWRIGNVDTTVIAERPAIGPHKARMIQNIAEALTTPVTHMLAAMALAVIPASSGPLRAATTVTPVAKRPIMARSRRRSSSLTTRA